VILTRSRELASREVYFFAGTIVLALGILAFASVFASLLPLIPMDPFILE